MKNWPRRIQVVAGVALAFSFLLFIFSSQYIRQLATQAGSFQKAAIFLLSFTDSQDYQWITTICVGLYCATFIACNAYFKSKLRHIPGNNNSHGGRGWTLLFIIGFCSLAYATYAGDYDKAYFKSDFLTLLVGITAGQAVLWLCLWRKTEGKTDSLHEWVISALIFLLLLAALFHPYMGRSFQYRGEARWMGPFFNPNTFGPLMGIGATLAAGRLLSILSRFRAISHRSSGIGSVNKETWFSILLYSAVFAMMSLGLLKSYSRAAWLATFAAFLYISYSWLLLSTRGSSSVEPLAKGQAHRPVSFRLVRFLPGTIILVLALIVIAFWTFRNTEQPMVRRVFSVANLNDFSWRNRATTSIGSLQMLSDKPVTGFGWNRIQENYEAFYRPATLFEGYAVTLNDYFVLGLSVGLVGLGCFFFYIGGTFLRGHYGLLRANKEDLSISLCMATCRASFIVPLFAFVPQRGIFYICLATSFWMLLELGAEPPVAAGKSIAYDRFQALLAAGQRLRGKFSPKRSTVVIYGAIAIAITGGLLFRSQYDSVVRDPMYHQIMTNFIAAHPIAVSSSPDGKYVLYKAEEPGGFRISVQEIGSTNIIASNFSSGSQRSMTWRPDGQAVVFQEISGMDRPLYLLDFKTGKKRMLDLPVSRTALPPIRWNSTWSKLAYFHGDWRRGRLLVAEMEHSDEPIEIVESMSGTCDFAWSPDESLMASISASKPGIIAITTIDNLESRELPVVPIGDIESFAWSLDGKSVWVAARRDKDEYSKLFEVDLTRGITNNVSLRAEAMGDINTPVFLPDGKSYIYHVLVDGIIHAVLADRFSTSSRLIGPTNGVLRVTHAKPDGTSVYARFASLTAPPALIEIPLGNETPKTLYAPPESSVVTCSAPVSLRIPSFDGVEIPSYHWKSKLHPDGRPSGVVIEVHGGLHTQTYPTWEPTVSVLLQHGIDVITVNYRGSSGFGQTYERMGNDFERVQDVIAARNYAVNVLKVDPKKVYLMGNSRGSSLVAAAAAHGEEIGGLVLISWAGPLRDVDVQVSKGFTILGFQGELDPFVSPANSKASIEGFFAPAKDVKLNSRWHSFKSEGHFFYESESLAKICWEIIRLNKAD